ISLLGVGQANGPHSKPEARYSDTETTPQFTLCVCCLTKLGYTRPRSNALQIEPVCGRERSGSPQAKSRAEGEGSLYPGISELQCFLSSSAPRCTALTPTLSRSRLTSPASSSIRTTSRPWACPMLPCARAASVSARP